MPSCSINTECHMDDLVSAIQDIVDARDEDLATGEGLSETISTRFFNTHYPRLSDAISDALSLIEGIEEVDHRNRLVSLAPAEKLALDKRRGSA